MLGITETVWGVGSGIIPRKTFPKYKIQ